MYHTGNLRELSPSCLMGMSPPPPSPSWSDEKAPQTLLPALVLLADRCHVSQQRHEYTQHPTSEQSAGLKKSGEKDEAEQRPTLRYITTALAWALFAGRSLVTTRQSNGAICPAEASWPSPAVALQLLVLGLDVAILALVSQRLTRQQTAGPGPSQPGLAGAFLSAAVALALFLALTASTSDANFQELVAAPHVRDMVLRDLIIDSVTVAGILVSGMSCMAHTTSASTLTFLGGATAVASHHNFWLVAERGAPQIVHAASRVDVMACVLAVVATVLLSREALRFEADALKLSTADRAERKRRTMACLASLSLLLGFNVLRTTITARPDAQALVAQAQRTSDAWLSAANSSQTLGEAVAEYKKRYGLAPPPNFDAWYAFATAHESPVIDSFDTIHADLVPFWGLRPAELRARTGHLMAQAYLGIGGMRIQNGSVLLSDLTPGTHRWMMEGYRDMIEPFARHLPDMDLAFNIDDECRVVMPLEELLDHVREGARARERVAHLRDAGRPVRPSFSAAAAPPWSDAYLGLTRDDHGPWSDYFTGRGPLPIYDDFVAATCPPSSPARQRRWWDAHTAPPAARHSLVSSDADNDICDRPDLARTHGFLVSPAAFAVTRHAMPVFSQGRAGGFNDILVPSPWNFVAKVDVDERSDVAWRDKADAVFWRGSATDGFSRGGTWPSYLRARLVNLARSHLGASTAEGQPAVNVSFVGPFGRCDAADCLAETAAFYGSPTAPPPPGIDFQDHWAYRHLVDLDGAGFSGRFLPFLRSKSLVYRASIFRTWYDERVHPWRHYVPLDPSLGGIWDVVRFVSGTTGGKGSSAASLAEQMAGSGREWALRALRREDMQIYMFRLLLEWARLVDDARDDIAYEWQDQGRS